MRPGLDEPVHVDAPGAAGGSLRWELPTPTALAALIVAFVAGVALRWRLLSTPLSYVDLDEATVALQARDFLSHPAVFFPGQPYGGTLEVPFVAVLAQLGADGPLALKLVPMAFHLAACVVAWRVAVRVVPSQLGQLAVPAVLWCGPAFGVWESTKERAFYGAAILLAITVVLLALRVLEQPGRGRAAALGAGIGLSCWATPLLATVLAPLLVWLAVRRPQLWRLVPWTALGALAGAAPWLAWNIRNGWASLEPQSSLGVTALDRLGDGIERLPQLVGLVTPFSDDRALVAGADTLTYVLVAVGVVVATVRTRARAPGLLATLVVGFFAVYALITTTAFVGTDLRYFYVLLPTLVMVGAATLPDVRHLGAGLIAIVVATVGLAWWGIEGMAAEEERDLFTAAPGLDDVVDRLEQLGVQRVISDIAGYQIAYATDGRIEGTVFNRPRFAELERSSLVEEPSTYVLLAGSDNARFEQEMSRRGVGFERERYGVWVVYRLDSWLPPWEAGFRLPFDVPVPRPDADG